MNKETNKLNETLFAIRYTGRDVNNNVQQARALISDLESSQAENVRFASEALPGKVASILRDIEALNNASKAIRPFISPPSNNTPAGIFDGGFSIQTKYFPATDTKGARIKAWRVDRLKGKTESLFCSFDYGNSCPHESAALEWFARFGKSLDIPGGFTLFKGSCDKGRIFTVNFKA
jgi:hypothetical protein